jgi:hypothetical protein
VLFSERSVFANPFHRNMHIGKGSCIEATFNHGNPRELGRLHATNMRFTDLDWSGNSPLLFQPAYKPQQSVWFPGPVLRSQRSFWNIYLGSSVVLVRPSPAVSTMAQVADSQRSIS